MLRPSFLLFATAVLSISAVAALPERLPTSLQGEIFEGVTQRVAFSFQAPELKNCVVNPLTDTTFYSCAAEGGRLVLGTTGGTAKFEKLHVQVTDRKDGTSREFTFVGTWTEQKGGEAVFRPALRFRVYTRSDSDPFWRGDVSLAEYGVSALRAPVAQ